MANVELIQRLQKIADDGEGVAPAVCRDAIAVIEEQATKLEATKDLAIKAIALIKF